MRSEGILLPGNVRFVLGHNERVRLHVSDEETAQIIAFLKTLSGPAPVC